MLTSGNVSDEPIAYRDDDALARLAPSPTPFLLHDRPIHTRTDDSVARVVRGRPTLLRRSRGLVPVALPSRSRARARSWPAARSSRARSAWPGAGARVGRPPHRRPAQRRDARVFREGIAHFERLFDVPPRSSRTTCTRLPLDRLRARARGRRPRRRAAPPRASRGLPGRARPDGPAVGAIYDGTGLGTDGTAWGGEILVGDLRSFERVAHLPAGAAARRRPRGARAVADGVRLARRAGAAARRPGALRGRVARDRWAPSRGWRRRVRGAGDDEHGPSLRRRRGALRRPGGRHLRGPGGDRARGARRRRRDRGLSDRRPRAGRRRRGRRLHRRPGPLVSARFHRAVAARPRPTCAAADAEHVVLSGGVFQNRLLLAGRRSSSRRSATPSWSLSASPRTTAGSPTGRRRSPRHGPAADLDEVRERTRAVRRLRHAGTATAWTP